jgi:DNA-binding NtrC family response regulator
VDAARILVVDDEPDMVDNLTRILRHAGYRCLAATDPQRALELIETSRPDLVLTDLRMPGLDGLGLIDRARDLDPALPVVVITAYATIESAVEAIRRGAVDYVTKPFLLEPLLVVVERALRQRVLQQENQNLRQQLRDTLVLDDVVGRSPAMLAVYDLVLRAARSDANVLILGESGTGKELIARAVHNNSARAGGPFVPVDCAAIPETLLESELFGHEKGAFTGAIRTKAGLMELAHGGTLFLDEIAELPLPLQGRLLRALQERQIRRVGGTTLIDVDVRVVSATNRDLREAAAGGRFREELYYRVNVIEIRLPPLRERGGDIRLLALAFLKRYGLGQVHGFDESVLEALEAYTWPGNVRELQNVVERACALADADVVRRADLPTHVLEGGVAEPTATVNARVDLLTELPLRDAKERWMRLLEGTYLRDLLARHRGNLSAAAREAGVDRKTFHRLLKKYEVDTTRRRRPATADSGL